MGGTQGVPMGLGTPEGPHREGGWGWLGRIGGCPMGGEGREGRFCGWGVRGWRGSRGWGGPGTWKRLA